MDKIIFPEGKAEQKKIASMPEIYRGNTNGNAMQTYALEMAVRGYYPVVRGQIALTLPMTDENITGFIERR